MTERLSFFAPCARGIEPLLADELRALKIPGVRPQRAGVLFSGSLVGAYRALLWSRFASRVLLRLGEVDASSADALYTAVREEAWEDHLRASGSIAIDAVGVNDALRNTQFTAVRVKDAVADRFRDRFGRRPDVDTRAPDVRVNVALRGERATISLDLAGRPLHQRGYRRPGVQVAAPLKETVAAAVLAVAGWSDIAAAGGGLLDPMCGSGTIAIEGALIACDIAPGLLRPEHAVARWLGHDEQMFERELEHAHRRRDAGLAAGATVLASDADASAVEVARDCVRRAGLDGVVEVRVAQLSSARPPTGIESGLVAVNPPYGERLSEREALPALYRELADVLEARFCGWSLAAITPDDRLGDVLGWRQTASRELYNGKILSPVRVFAVGEAASTASGAARSPHGSSAAGPVPSVDDVAFANRLKKMHAHLGKWARRSGVSCYRVYDADLPDFNMAIDVYAGAGADEGATWIYVAEYAPPRGVDERLAAARLQAAVERCAAEFGVEPDSVFVKRRERQRGAEQYVRLSRRRSGGVVAENGLLFEVNFSDYLDTGLFLDHRDTRAWLRQIADGARFANLFAYTGSATVYAAAGGAVSTATVDLSTTYLDWARRNLERNGLAGEAHTFERADTLSWLADAALAGREFDLVFCDPPTFSNSKRTETTFDVQRDHVSLLEGCAGVLAPDGTIVFSCNRRRFELDTEALGGLGLEATDVTARTIPKDFERTPRVHSCWTIRRA